MTKQDIIWICLKFQRVFRSNKYNLECSWLKVDVTLIKLFSCSYVCTLANKINVFKKHALKL